MATERDPEAAEPENAAPPPPPLDADWAPDLRTAVKAFTNAQPAPRTRHEYEKALRGFFQELRILTLGELLAVTSERVVDYRNGLQARGLAASTINTRLAAVRGIFARLLVERRISGNPADPELVPGMPVSDVSRTEGLSVDDVREILATCDGTLRGLRDRALLMTLFYQGLRRSEASKLRYRDITTKRGLLEVKGAKNNPYDTVRLRPEVRAAIEAYLEVLNRDLERRETRPDDPVFVSLSKLRSFGKKLAPSSINEIVKERVKAAGIQGRRITAHSWRHACTTAALQAGVPIHQVQRHLRHKDVRTTLRYDRERDVRKNPTLEMMPNVE
jgi:integrase